MTLGNYYDHQFLFDNSTVSIDGISLKYPFQTINTTIITTIIVMLFNFGVIYLIKIKIRQIALRNYLRSYSVIFVISECKEEKEKNKEKRTKRVTRMLGSINGWSNHEYQQSKTFVVTYTP